MELNKKPVPPWLDASHPNFKRWECARKLSYERGDFVKSILELHIKCSNLTILDLGSGEGGTSKILSKDNVVISFDLSLIRLERQKTAGIDYFLVNGDALEMPFKKHKFDLIIIQDVIEHLSNLSVFISNIKGLLKGTGIIYISTPNKFSIINFLSDPHWGMPIISVLKREHIKKYFLNNFRKDESGREDIAQLLSLKGLIKNIGREFKINIHTNYAVEKLFEGHKGIAWSKFHLGIIRLLKALRFKNIILKLSNNKPGLLNKFFTPTFYLILKR